MLIGSFVEQYVIFHVRSDDSTRKQGQAISCAVGFVCVPIPWIGGPDADVGYPGLLVPMCRAFFGTIQRYLAPALSLSTTLAEREYR